MTPLPVDLRQKLEKAVVSARQEAESAAGAVLANLAVFQETAFPTMSAGDRRLRNLLRARCRALGEGSLERGRETLIEEIAYKAWHRMVFARFLAENNLLMHPGGASLTIGDCGDLAREEQLSTGAAVDAWDVAARFAGEMLPGIFNGDDPTSQAAARLAVEGRIALERILTSLPAEVFTADDALGWIYQFWQSMQKKAVSNSGRKIGAQDLPPVTQLFTEDYIVRFLLDNSLGAWWAARHPDSPLVDTFAYLRLRAEGTPAAGTFPSWPARAAEVTVMDPCCGSGHFLVAAFDMLRRMRMEEEALDEVAAGDAVLRDNLFGLEIDPRCTQIAAFALAFAAWKAGGYRPLPIPSIACSGIPVTGQIDTWRRLARGDGQLAAGLDRLYDLFRKAPTLGSLIDPNAVPIQDRMFLPDFARLEPLLSTALERERAEAGADPAAAVFGEGARGVARAAQLLAGTYTLVATNVPYLARGKQDDELKAYCAQHYPDAKADLATAFVERCRAFARDDGCGSYALVTPQNWLFLATYRKLREKLLREQEWNHMSRLGPRAFETISGEVVNVALLILTNQWPARDHQMTGIDASEPRTPSDKAATLRRAPLEVVEQATQFQNPDARISIAGIESTKLLEAYANGLQGIATADYPRFGRCFWEVPRVADGWAYQQSTVRETIPYGGREHILWWQDGRGELAALPGAYIRGLRALGKTGVAVSQMRDLPVTLYTGELFDNNTAVILPRDPAHLPAVWAFCSSPAFNQAVRRIDQALKVTNATLVKVPFDLEHWQRVADERYPNGLPAPSADDPTQWLFTGHPRGSTAPLQVAVARLLGYRWPEQPDDDGLDAFADADRIVPLPAMNRERSAAERLRALLATAWGAAWSPALEARLLADVGFANRSLDDWLMNGFFEQHVQLFHNRPFIWHVWDGRKDGFSALVNAHALDGAKLDRLIYTYLGSWISRQRAERDADVPGAEARLAAALELERKLKLICGGEKPYDIYVRWKPLREQPIGWEPDLNDGVRLNLRPWIEPFGKPADSPLRSKVNVKWGKDPGKNPDGSERRNDIHLSLDEKRAARDAVQAGAD